MQKDSVYTDKILDEKARRLFANERRIKRLDGWFLIREISEEYESAHPFIPAALRKACALLPGYANAFPSRSTKTRCSRAPRGTRSPRVTRSSIPTSK